MPTDYKPRDGLKQKKNMPGYIWLLSGLAIGLFIALLIYIDKQPISAVPFNTAVQQELEQLKQNKTDKKPVSVKTPAPSEKRINTEEKEPKYNFYTILQGMKVLIPESETQAPVSTSSIDTKKSGENKQYILQAGSFQNKNDAEKLKIKLAFIGVEANIQEVTVNNQIWHRVRTSPYKDKNQLYQSMKTLQRNKINAISMEVKP